MELKWQHLAIVTLLILFIGGTLVGQLQQSGGTTVTQGPAGAAAWLVTGTGGTFPATESGTWSVRAQDGSGNNLTSTSSALDVNLKSGSIANTAFAINAGTSLIGTQLPKTGCGTTAYDSGPTNLPSSLTSLTTTATCIEAVYCKNLTASAHPVTVTDQSTACNSAACNLVPPAFSLTALGDVRFPLGFVKAVGGIKWNSDATNSVTCWIEGIQ